MSTKLFITIAAGLAFISLLGAPGECQTRRHNRDKEKEAGQASISVMDSTEAQWGMRSVNDSLYRGYPLNAVYLERGRTRLPASFPHYQQGKLGTEIVVGSPQTTTGAITSIKVNGVETPIGGSESNESH